MPTYVYLCPSCGYKFEDVRSIHDATEVGCRACGEKADKVFVAPFVQFKGGGWGGSR